MVRDFRTLKVWQTAHRLTLAVYEASAAFPKDEKYGLTSQVRRSAASIAANISEGCGRDGDAEFARFLEMAMGSASELEYHLLLAHDLKLLGAANHGTLNRDVIQVKRMLATFIRTLRPKPRSELRR